MAVTRANTAPSPGSIPGRAWRCWYEENPLRLPGITSHNTDTGHLDWCAARNVYFNSSRWQTKGPPSSRSRVPSADAYFLAAADAVLPAPGSDNRGLERQACLVAPMSVSTSSAWWQECPNSERLP